MEHDLDLLEQLKLRLPEILTPPRKPHPNHLPVVGGDLSMLLGNLAGLSMINVVAKVEIAKVLDGPNRPRIIVTDQIPKAELVFASALIDDEVHAVDELAEELAGIGDKIGQANQRLDQSVGELEDWLFPASIALAIDEGN